MQQIFCVTGDLAITTCNIPTASLQQAPADRNPTGSCMTWRDGTWVIGDFIEMCAVIYEDVDGNGKQDDTDLYGYGCYPCNPSDVWLTSFDQPLTGRDADGNITIDIMTEKTVTALEKISNFHFNTEGCRVYKNQWDERKYFPQGLAVFAPLAFDNCFNSCRDMQDSYGMLPNPKWDEAQERYLTNAYDQFSVYGVPLSVPTGDLEFVGTIYECLNAESYSSYPAYYDVALGVNIRRPTPPTWLTLSWKPVSRLLIPVRRAASTVFLLVLRPACRRKPTSLHTTTSI